MAITLKHCKKLDAVYSGGLIAVGPFLVTLSMKGISRDKVRFEELADCTVCLIKHLCTGHVTNRVPEALLVLLK